MRDIRPGDWIRYGTRDSSWVVAGRVRELVFDGPRAPVVAVVDVEIVRDEENGDWKKDVLNVILSKDFDLKEIVYGVPKETS